MNKRNVEGNMNAAIQAIQAIQAIKEDTCGDIINQSMRGKMSSFGAAVMMSGVAPAVAYFAKNEPNVLRILYAMYREPEKAVKELSQKGKEDIEEVVKELFKKEKEEILEKAVSVKLAMNLFIKDNNNGESDGKTEE